MLFRSFSRWETVLLVSLAAINFTHIVDFVMMMPLGPQLMRVFAINPHEFGMLVSSYTFAAGISGIAGATFMDRFDRKKSLLFLYGGFCVGTIACGLADSYETLRLARILTGMFGGLISSMVFSIVGDSIPIERRGAAMGILMTAFSVASIFGIPAALSLANTYNWKTPFLVLGGLSVILWGIIVAVVPPVRSHLHKGVTPTGIRSLFKVIDSHQQVLAIALMILLVFGQFSIIPFLSPSLVANAGLLESQLPLFYFIGGLGSIVASPIIGRFVDRFGPRRILTIMGTLSIIPFWLVTNLGQQPLWAIMTIGTTFFIVMSGRMVPAITLVTGTVPPQKRGSFMAVSSSLQQFTSAGASFIAGLVVIKNADGHLLHYPTVGYIGVVMTILAVLFVNARPFRNASSTR